MIIGESHFLIKLLTTTKEKEWLSTLEDDLRTVENIRLYNLPDKKNPKEKIIVLRVKRGKFLLLKKNDRDDKDYFISIGCCRFPEPPNNKSYYHELPSSVEIRVIEELKDSHDYLPLDCAEIDREVKTKKEWKPSKGNAPEEKKWQVYLNLYENITKRAVFKIKGKSRIIKT